MRRATLYTLNQQEVMAGDYVELHQMHMQPDQFTRVAGTDEALAFMDIKRVPVHYVRKIECGKRTDHYIAIEPDLEEILEAPFIRKVEEARFNERCARQIANHFVDRITDFNAQPWYTKIWICLRGQKI